MKHLESSAHEYRVVPLEVRRSSKARARPLSFSLKIPVTTILIGFFLSRALLLDELLPFGLAYLAAVYRSPRPRPGWAALGVAAGYASLAAESGPVIYPYYAATLLVWLVGVNQKMRQKTVTGYSGCLSVFCWLERP